MPFYPAPLPLTVGSAQVSELTAGTNVNITTNAGNATISATGGGGGGGNIGAYSDETASRSLGTTYTNSNSTALRVTGWCYSGGSGGGGVVGEVAGVEISYFGNSEDNASGFCFDVPAGETYKVLALQAGATLTKWFEALWA